MGLMSLFARRTNDDEDCYGADAPRRGLEQGVVPAAFPVDAVYTWVDGSDREFVRERKRYLRGLGPEAAEAIEERWRDHEELRFSLRSLAAYAPWINHIYLVTNGQVQRWLKPGSKLSIMRHDEIIDRQYLPTFNSHVIESALHNIPGLSEHFIYFNDDVMLLRPMQKEDFFTGNGLVYGILAKARLPNGPPSPYDLPSVWAAKNSASLVFREWGYFINRRFKHTFYPQRRSVALDNERRFAADYAAFRPNRFRGKNDLVTCTTLHGCAAYLTGKGLLRRNRSLYVSIRSRAAPRVYAEALAEKATEAARDSICLNDAGETHEFPRYDGALQDFLNSYYPKRSPFER